MLASPPPVAQRDAGFDDELRAELRFLAQKQRARLEKLRNDAEVQLGHYGLLKKQELMLRRDRALAAERELLHGTPSRPGLEHVRAEHSRLRTNGAGHEERYRELAEQYQTTQTRLKVLREAIDGQQLNTGDGRTGIAAMRSHLEEIGKDKQELLGKIKRALDCLMVDENMLKSRLEEEQHYAGELRQMVGAVDEEVAGHSHVAGEAVRSLDHDVRVVEERLGEMKNMTRDMYDQYLHAVQALRTTQEDVLLAVGEATTEVAHNQELRAFKDHAMHIMEGKIDEMQHEGVMPMTLAQVQHRSFWLEQKVAVLSDILKSMQLLREKRQVQEQDELMLAHTTQKCNKSKAELHAIEQKVEGKDKYRRKLIDEIVDMRMLLDEKLRHEDELVYQLEQLLQELGEDVQHVREIVDAEGFDNYVSSESEDEVVGDFVRLEGEHTGDVDAITTSLEYDPDDPSGAEALQRHAHRPEGPLRDFSEKRAAQLAARPPRPLAARLQGPAARRPLTLESVLMDAQVHAANQVLAVIKARTERINSGTYDLVDDQIIPDPEQRTRNERIRQQVEAYKERNSAPDPSVGGGRFGRDAAAGSPQQPRPQPTDAGLVAGTQDENAVAYLQRAVGGFTAMMFFSGPVGPFQRHVFLSKDLRSVAWHRPVSDAPPGSPPQEDESILIADVKTVATGHRTEVFRQHQAQAPLRENAALSIITQQQTSVDLELDRAEERDYWASIISTIAAESRPGGAVHSVLAADRVKVYDASSQHERSAGGEPYDRRHISLRLA